MKKLLVLLVVIAFAASAMAQEATLTVEVNVMQYATLEVVEGTMVLNLNDDVDYLGGAPDAPIDSGNAAELRLNANYVTNLQVTTSELTENIFGFSDTEFLKVTKNDGSGEYLGAWPQIGTVYAGGSIFSHSGTFPLIMNGLTTGSAGSGIPAGIHTIYAGVSSNITRTQDGEWASPGTYIGDFIVTVVPHP